LQRRLLATRALFAVGTCVAELGLFFCWAHQLARSTPLQKCLSGHQASLGIHLSRPLSRPASLTMHVTAPVHPPNVSQFRLSPLGRAHVFLRAQQVCLHAPRHVHVHVGTCVHQRFYACVHTRMCAHRDARTHTHKTHMDGGARARSRASIRVCMWNEQGTAATGPSPRASLRRTTRTCPASCNPPWRRCSC